MREKTKEKRDVGVMFTPDFKPKVQCAKAAKKAVGVLSQITRAFHCQKKDVLPRICNTYVSLHLENAVQAWALWTRGEIDQLERVQKRMVTMVQGLKGSTYEEKLVEMGMETLEERRRSLDMVQTFKIVRKIDDVDSSKWFQLIPENRHQRTRLTKGGINLERGASRLDLRRNFFSQRVIEGWNALPSETKNAKTVSEFKRRLKA